MILEICPICDQGKLELYVWMSDVDIAGVITKIPCTAQKCDTCESVIGGWVTTNINKLIMGLYK